MKDIIDSRNDRYVLLNIYHAGMSLAVLEGVLHGAGGEDSRDQNLDMVMVYDNSNQVEWRSRYRSRIM